MTYFYNKHIEEIYNSNKTINSQKSIWSKYRKIHKVETVIPLSIG